MATGAEVTDTDRAVSAIALIFPANDHSTSSSTSTPPKLPRRLRRLLPHPKSPSTAADIESRLEQANLRRKQLYELSSKARPKSRSPQQSSSSPFQVADLSQQLEAKLNAAEQKRLSILATAQMRLARMDELRQAAKTGLEMRFEKERDELGTKMESRVQQAEANRMLLLKASCQRLVAKRERSSQLMMQKMVQDRKYKEVLHDAILKKRAAAEKKRLGLLEAEKGRVHAKVLKAQQVAKSIYMQREFERMRKKDQLEDRLQRAKKQRAEYLRHRRSLHGSGLVVSKMMNEQQGDYLLRKLARCWRQFLTSSKTTAALAKAFMALEISEKSVKSMPFEQLALQIESATTIRTLKVLLDRLESRYKISQAAGSNLSSLRNIDHLLKCVAPPIVKGNASIKRKETKTSDSNKEAVRSLVKLSRYPVRVVLCAYMILGYPGIVFSGKSEHEVALADSACKFVTDFELLIKIMLVDDIQNANDKMASTIPSRITVRSQLEAFDKAWCSYLYHFVLWKVKDAKSLEEDLVRTACQLELSMMQTCNLTSEGDDGGLTHDMVAIQKQVTEEQKLLRTKVQHLSGNSGLERLGRALCDTRSRFLEANDSGSPSAFPVPRLSSSSLPGSSEDFFASITGEMINLAEGRESFDPLIHSLSERHDPSSVETVEASTPFKDSACGDLNSDAMLIGDNEFLVNEIVHEHRHGFADSFIISDADKSSSPNEKVRETMEAAFWDSIMESMKQEEPDFSWVLKLMNEVRDELCKMSPQSWKKEIVETINIDTLSKVLKSGMIEMEYFQRILEFSLVNLQKLSAPANDDEMKENHHKLLKELGELSQVGENSSASFAILMIRGLRFVLQQIQALKRDISKARIRIIEPLIKGPAGLEYLKKAFSNRYGSPADAPTSLPLTRQWLSSVQVVVDQEWDEYRESLSALKSDVKLSQGFLPTTLRTGGSIQVSSKMGSPTFSATGKEQPECKGKRVDLTVRLGLLKLVSAIGGLTLDTLPETLKLNLSRLRAVQSKLQKMIVMSTSMLILRQTLVSENLVTSPSDMDGISTQCVKELADLLDGVEDVGVPEIVEAISRFSEGDDHAIDAEKLLARKQVMASMLAKSLQAADPIFVRVSHNVYLALRGAVLGGNGMKGKQLVETALRRVGSALLTEKIMEVAEVLIVLAVVSANVHGAWYEEVLNSL